ncbi:hypothetical protein GCM10010121_071980 [Streptomyces brasiliensis]|uniref:Uncharacterized protein n=1 Tax=Streptomyces brasiliensis TaxID=1954 RepID=A0A917L952_9ACTN|nr:hypothetical protein GCM10010121_071980 [Streptomyces brasiliensis]
MVERAVHGGRKADDRGPDSAPGQCDGRLLGRIHMRRRTVEVGQMNHAIRLHVQVVQGAAPDLGARLPQCFGGGTRAGVRGS